MRNPKILLVKPCDVLTNFSQGVKYQLFYPNTARDQVSSAGTSVLQAYGKHVKDSDSVHESRAKIENEIRRLPTATWTWENQSELNELGDLECGRCCLVIILDEWSRQQSNIRLQRFESINRLVYQLSLIM